MEYAISGIKVKFPYKPYPSQFTMMDKVIRCIVKKQNSLLESPTGSGKSLALLCSSLSWLTIEKERLLKQKLELKRLALERSINEMMDFDDDYEIIIKEEEKPDIKVKIEQLNESNDIKPIIKTESDPETKVKIEKQEHGEEIDQKPVKSEVDGTNVRAEVKIEKTDQSYNEEVSDDNQVPTTDKGNTVEQAPGTNANSCSAVQEGELSDDDTDFQAPRKRYRTSGGQIPRAKKSRQTEDELCCGASSVGMSSVNPEWSVEHNQAEDVSTNSTNTSCKDRRKNTVESMGDLEDELDELERISSPKIYFGTRTHKQITQIVRELNKTEYRTTKMCILASREFTCIHPYVSQAKNKTEECRKSIENKEGKSCSYYARSRYVKNQKDLEDYGITKAWDISELVEIGEGVQGCPYYMTREIMKGADIIFCPYNYLIDPIIRRQMDIGLVDQIVILDEAHNIEDSSREAASWSVTLHHLDEAMTDLDYLVSNNIHRESHRAFHQVCATLRRWIAAKADDLQGSLDYSKCSKIWEGQELKKELGSLGFVPAAIRLLHLISWVYKMLLFGGHFRTITNPGDQSVTRKRMERTNIHAATASLLEGLLMVLTFITKDNYKYLGDYRVAITKDYQMLPTVMPNGFRRRGEYEQKLVHTLNFWCLSPAVAFAEIGKDSRSVILTSGTLSPMSTFASELGCDFPIQLEANHVVGGSQVWVSSLSVGPSGSTLEATYRFAETFAFQDEIGEAIYKVCEVVPHGVLCFLPSYNMLDKLTKRWKMTGLWGRLCALKNTFSEPRGGDKTDFNDLMIDFYDCIKLSEDSDDERETAGALFFAVCRGKVSEGLDFADNNARAVITVGIPFPSVKDIKIELKRKYNNLYCSVRGLLNGSEWYETQAYRALNQALGRCIRHRNDWGAILMIDNRFGKSPKYRNGLSKWLRNKVVHHDNFRNLLSSLKEFTTARQENPCPNNTASQTPTDHRTPKRSKDSNESKSSQEWPVSINSSPMSSQTPSTKNAVSISDIKHEAVSITSSVPNCHQKTPLGESNQISEKPGLAGNTTATPSTPPQLTSANHVSSSTPIVGREVAPKVLYLSPLNPPQFAGAINSPQGMANPQCMAHPRQRLNLANPQVMNNQRPVSHIPQVMNNQRPVNMIQQLNNLRQPLEANGPVLLRFVTPSGQPVRHALISGQQLQLLTHQTSGNNVVFNIAGAGMQGAPGVRSLHQGGVGQGILMNMNGQAGGHNLGLNSAGYAIAGSKGPVCTSGVHTGAQGEHGSLLSAPGTVRIKEEPKSPPDTQQGTSGVNQGLHVNQRDALGNCASGMRLDSNLTQEGVHAKGNRVQRRSLFSADESSVCGGEETTRKASKDTNYESKNMDKNDGSKLPKGQNNVPEPLKISKSGVTESIDNIPEEDPESPLLFCTPPTSFESDDDRTENNAEGGKGPNKETMGQKGACSEARTNISSNTCIRNVKCKTCNSHFYLTVDRSADDDSPEDVTTHYMPPEDISIHSMLGSILNSLFSLNTSKKKKISTLKTFHFSGVNAVQGCCPLFTNLERKQTKQDVKINSIYCGEQSQCYIPLVCLHCTKTRSSRARESVIAVRALPCGNVDNKTKSMTVLFTDLPQVVQSPDKKDQVWFLRDKVW